MSAYLTGKYGTAIIGSTELSITGWDINPTAQIEAFINSKTGNHSQLAPTFDEGGIFNLDYDITPTDNPYVAPLTLRPGMQLTNVKLYLDHTNNPTLAHNFPSAFVMSMPQRLSVAGRIVNRITARVDGNYGLGGNAPA